MVGIVRVRTSAMVVVGVVLGPAVAAVVAWRSGGHDGALRADAASGSRLAQAQVPV